MGSSAAGRGGATSGRGTPLTACLAVCGSCAPCWATTPSFLLLAPARTLRAFPDRRTAVKWIHAKPFGGPYPPRPLATSGESLARAEQLLEEKRARREAPAEACVDKNEGCRDWADAGEVRQAGRRAGGLEAGLGCVGPRRSEPPGCRQDAPTLLPPSQPCPRPTPPPTFCGGVGWGFCCS